MFRVVGQTVVGNGIYEVEERANAVGHRSVGVPGITAGMCRAHELFGVLPLEQLLEPAVHYARDGFEADPTTRLMIATYMPNLVRYGEAARASSCRTDTLRRPARRSSSATWPTPSNGSAGRARTPSTVERSLPPSTRR